MSSDSFSGNIMKSNSGFDEQRWVVQIRWTVENEDVEEDLAVPVSIFNAPRALVASRPEAYIPQQVAIGPYHHLRPELDEMERFKLAAARRTQKQLPGLKFQLVVDRFRKHEFKIRSHYHRYLGFNGETLAWMMAVDAAFLLEFLYVLSLREAVQQVGSSKMSHLVDSSGRKSTHNAILRDTIMLENQIPLFLLRKLLDLRSGSPQECEEALSKMLLSYLKEVTPFKLIADFSNIKVREHAHLLDLLYFMLVPKYKEQSNEIHETEENETAAEDSNANSSGFGHLVDVIRNVFSSLKGRPIACIQDTTNSRPVRFLMKLPGTLISKIPVPSVLRQPLELIFSANKENLKSDEAAADEDSEKLVLVEEISIPSASELTDAGIRFVATKGDISTISFDPKTAIFYLPAVSLDANTEVILRNLVAYEASSSRGPMIFTRYTELMNGIIDTDEDVKLLKKMGIVFNGLKSDGEVASLWNAMTMSLKVTEVPSLDKIIEDVNRYYNSKWNVKMGKFMKKYVFGSWQLLTFLAAIILLLLNGLQAFCTAYSCSRWLNSRFKNLE